MIVLMTNEILHSSCSIQPFHVPAGEESDGAGGIAQQRARGEAGASVPVLQPGGPGDDQAGGRGPLAPPTVKTAEKECELLLWKTRLPTMSVT